MYRVMVMFDPVQCVATPLDSVSGQPRPSYERSFVPITDIGPDTTDNLISSDLLRPGKKSSTTECRQLSMILWQVLIWTNSKFLLHFGTLFSLKVRIFQKFIEATSPKLLILS